MNTAVANARPASVAQWLADSPTLRQRRFELLPVNGPGAPVSRPQGRGPGSSTTAVGLAELISSIASCGLLCPILAEEVPDPAGGAPQRWIVAGERRVQAIRRGATAAPDNPHFTAIAAVVCPGPLGEEERYQWQLIENLAREDLQPGELGAALLFERCSVLAGEFAGAGVTVPADITDEPDPVARYQRLERLRRNHPRVGAPWELVLRRLGLQLSPRKARAVVAALATLPREMSTEMDAHKVALHTRTELLRVCSGHADPAADLWAEVRRRGRPDLLAAAVRAHRAGLRPAAEAVDAAEAGRDVANAARSAALRRPTPAADAVTDRTDNHRPADGNAATDDGNTAADTAELVDATVVGATLTHLRGILTALREGRQLSRFDAGSLRLLTTQIQQHLATPAPHPAPTPEPATREGRAAA